MQRIGFYLTCLLMFLVPLGYLTRPHQWGETSSQAGRGVTTGVAILIIIVSLGSGRLFQALLQHMRFLALLLFGLLALVACLQVAPTDRGDAVSVAVQLVAYTLLCLSIISFDLTRPQMFWILRILSFSGVLMCFLALIDYFQIVSIPTMNDLYSVIKNEQEKTRIKSLSGPFRSRTEFAAHVAFILPVLVCASLEKSIPLAKRAPILIGAGIVGIACVVSGSRGLYLGIAASFFYIVLFNGQKKLFSYAIRLALIGGIATVGFAKWKPEIFAIIVHRVSTINPDQIQSSAADSVRLEAFKATVEGLMRRPYGYGFTQVYLVDYLRSFDAHSVYTEILRAAGPLGVVLVLFWAYPVLRRMVGPDDAALQLPIFGGIVSFAVYGLTHSPWSTNILWVMMGLAFLSLDKVRAPASAALSQAGCGTPVPLRYPLAGHHG